MVEIHVRDDRHAAVPGMGRIEAPAQADLDEGDIERLLGEPAEDDGGQQFELGRVAEAVRDPVRGHEDLADQPRERVGRDRTAVDDQPLAIRHEVRLGRLADPQARGPKRRSGQGQHAALAVRAGDERAAQAELRVAEFVEDGPDPPEAQVDAEPTAVGEGLEGLRVGEWLRDAGHSRDSSSS